MLCVHQGIRNVMKSVLTLDYRQLAIRYDLGSLQEGGDLVIDASGDLAVTVDGDLKLGNDQHNALHRLVVRWQMEAPILASMFDQVLGTHGKKQNYEAMINALLARPSLDPETASQFHELQGAIGINETGPGNAAGAIAVALNNLLRREWVDLGKPATWGFCGDKIAGYSFGNVIEAMANNFRHSDEWARHDPPTEQQLESIRIVAAIFGTPLARDGARHPYRGNVCPKLLLIISEGVFERLADRTFSFARSLAGL